jgi:Calcium-activated chloride channel
MAQDFKRQFKKYSEDLDENSLLKGNIVGEIILLAKAVKNAALGNQNIRIANAPKPTDIIWENLGIPYKSRVIWTVLSYTFTIIALGVSFGIAVSIKAIQISAEKTSSEWVQRILSLVASVVNVITGLLLDFFINWFNEMEDHKQYSTLYDSLMIKVTLVDASDCRPSSSTQTFLH